MRCGNDKQKVSYEILDDYYNRDYSVNENCIILKENYNISFSKSTLYEYCNNRNIKTDKNKLSDYEIMDLIDLTLSYRKSYEWFKDNNIKVGDKRLRRLYNKKKEGINGSYQGEYSIKENRLHTINVKTEKDRTLLSTLDNVKETITTTIQVPVSDTMKTNNNQNKSYVSAYNVSWGLTEKEDDDWDMRFDEEMERNSGMYCEDVLDDIVNWCNDFLS